MALESQVRDALKARTLGERVKHRIAGGLTVAQIFDRLPRDTQISLLNDDINPTVARREALDRVVEALFTHIDSGDVKRKRTRIKNATRAGIDVMVDVYRLV